MSYIILVDHRENNHSVSTIQDENDNIEIFDDISEALKVASTQFLAKSFTSFIIDLDDKTIIEVRKGEIVL